ncbi:MAG: NAD(P)/FAD-dependent oxidoreductase [Arthrobacter sp.]
MDHSTQIYDVIILGAGFGGLGMGAQLKREGLDNFLILEKAAAIGGVWRDNNYPGAACDTEAHLYCYSFAPHLRVSRMYAGRDEHMGYLQRLVDTFDLTPQLCLGTEVTDAVWDEHAGVWVIRSADGVERHARFFVPAWGQLNTPQIPAFDGLETFAGAYFHSAQWDHTVELPGKKVISVGAAASAVQYVPEVAKVAEHLTVLQRSPNWIMPRNQIVFTDDQLEAYEANPELFEESRQKLHAFRENGFARTRHNTDAQQEGMAQALAHLAAQVADEDLRHKLTPDYEFGCKRILRTDDYYPALMRENVELITERIDRIVPEGILTRDGTVHKADVIIFGTGFDSQAFQGELTITGVAGADLKSRWIEGPESYLGMAVDDFPNMFMVYGPNTNLNHNSIITMLEIQQRHIIQVLEALLPVRGEAVSVRPEALARFNEELQAQMQGSAFSSDCSSWYKNAAGKVINNWSGTVDEYRQLAETWDETNYIRHRIKEVQPA